MLAVLVKMLFCVLILVNIKAAMYPYHNKIKQRIANQELIRFEYVDNYKTISPCLLLYFKTAPYIRPIRSHRFEAYETILKEWQAANKH